MTSSGDKTIITDGGSRIFSLVISKLDVRVPTPIELVPDYFLRLATDVEALRIAEAITARGVVTLLTHWCKFDGESRPIGEQFWIIDAPSGNLGHGSPLDLLDKATRLTMVHLHCGNAIFFPTKQVIFSGMTGFDPFRDTGNFALAKVIDVSAVERIRSVLQGIERVKVSHPQIIRAIEMYCYLDNIPVMTSFYTLGIFMVIESLLTHNPTGGHDSLRHQIAEKMRLLNRRFGIPLDFSLFGQGQNVQKQVWNALYTLRSCLAHGKDPDLDKVKILGGVEKTTTLLDSAAQALLRHALQEPELVLDLQDL